MSAPVENPAANAAAVNIPIAGFKDVYDVNTVDRALQELSPSASEALKSLYEKMIKAGGTRLSVKPSGIPVMDDLYEELPNFAEVLDDLRKHIAMMFSYAEALVELANEMRARAEGQGAPN